MSISIGGSFRAVNGSEIRRRRLAAGLTVEQVARAAGLMSSDLTAYEDDGSEIDSTVANRLDLVVATDRDSPIHHAQLITIPAVAAAIRVDLHDADVPVADSLRYVREAINNSVFVTAPVDRAAFFAEPSPTGHRGWDALLAGVVDVLASRQGFNAPAWTANRYVTPFWFVGTATALHAYAFANSPVPLANRGVFIDPADLESV